MTVSGLLSKGRLISSVVAVLGIPRCRSSSRVSSAMAGCCKAISVAELVTGLLIPSWRGPLPLDLAEEKKLLFRFSLSVLLCLFLERVALLLPLRAYV